MVRVSVVVQLLLIKKQNDYLRQTNYSQLQLLAMSGVKMKTYLSVQRFFAISVFTSLLGTSVTQVGEYKHDVLAYQPQ